MLPGVEMLPLESRVVVAEGVWIVCDPPPVTNAVEVRLPAATTVTVPPEAAVGTAVHTPATHWYIPVLLTKNTWLSRQTAGRLAPARMELAAWGKIWAEAAPTTNKKANSSFFSILKSYPSYPFDYPRGGAAINVCCVGP